MDARQDERGREVRARLLGKPFAFLVALALILPPAAAASAAGDTTGRLLVTLDRPARVAHRGEAAAVMASAGARRAGFSVPQIGLVTLRPGPGESLRGLARRLRRDPRVARVEQETRAFPRYEPDDPALRDQETASGTAPGTPVEWWAAREGFPAAWQLEEGEGAVVAVIDTGIDATHPDLAPSILATASFDPGAGPGLADDVGHGTHVASLACAAGDNGIGMAGAGLHCKLLVVKSDFTDSSVAAGIVWAVDHGAAAINMSFGTNPGTHPTAPILNAINYAYRHNVVMVAAAADSPIQEQGHPANVLQPTGTGPNIAAGKGLSVTAATFAGRRAAFAGLGTQISLAAYGTYDERLGPPGIFGAFTASTNELERGQPGIPAQPPCGCRATFDGDPRYAYLQGTSMAVPMVAATAALVRRLNPDLRAAEVIRLIKQTAQRPAGAGWNRDLGWGILSAGAALAVAQRMDRRPPSSAVAKVAPRTHRRAIRVRWSGQDFAPPRIRLSGIARYDLWESIDRGRFRRVYSGRAKAKLVRLRPGSRYAFYTTAVDRAGNRERPPARPDVTITALP